MQEAIALMKPDSRQEFAELLECHRKIVFKVANTYAWQAEDRDELAQEIATQMWRAYPCYDPTRSFSTWMYRIALNVAISYVRSQSQRTEHLLALEDSHDVTDPNAVDFEADQHVRALHRVIQQLEPLNRALLLLYLDDRSSREIAEILGLSESNVTTKLNRLKQRIRTELV